MLITNKIQININTIMKGTVKWFNSEKRFGFIQSEEGNDIFVHYSGIAKNNLVELTEGQKVTFEIIEGKRGPQAIEVKVVE